MSENKQIRVLYIEDNEGHARLMGKRLEKNGKFHIDWVPDPLEGLKKAKQGYDNYDVVIVDHNLAGKSGLEVIRQIATQKNVPPTIMLTGSGNEELAVKALQSGASNYIVKDVNSNYLELMPIVLCSTIEKHKTEIEKKRAEEETRKLSVAVEQSPAMVIITDSDCNIEYVNKKFSRVTGYSQEEVKGKNPRILKSGIHQNEYFTQLWESITSGEEWCGEFCNRKKNGETYWTLSSISPMIDSDGTTTHYISMQEDITERKKQEELIRHMAYHDSLTGLPNRITFYDRLYVALANAKRDKHIFAVIYIDLDRFKQVNDTLGHEIGDKVLQATTQIMKSFLRESDTLSRMGGDEFLLLLPKIKTREDAQAVREKFLEAFQKPLKINGHEITIDLSMGTSFYPQDGEEPDILVKKADDAMYRAKQNSKDNSS